MPTEYEESGCSYRGCREDSTVLFGRWWCSTHGLRQLVTKLPVSELRTALPASRALREKMLKALEASPVMVSSPTKKPRSQVRASDIPRGMTIDDVAND